ncbi:ABC transporter substrate-binding protein [Neorhizobium petrolearium]|uniref:ABC transporter substrate-binding protein n=1 Tax=Neorhizobium petrolearium TaxID=515361 RepID=A0ABY8M2T7_9HYPH|nr:ABC transporter substrate-binding protein [Neorhizobium petrolearium]MCC2612912.1 ABC transporter substrate-binding protein [Neorhizobium petrolearium]WGI68021.1 ABC transporter substrate-binding protein [Neorhizobium petrolearium]
MSAKSENMRVKGLSRRSLLSAAAVAPFGLAAPARAASPAPVPKVASLDYGLASTLMNLGITPTAIVSLADWDKWVIEPEIPAGVADLGNGWEINFEVLAMLKPDLILTTPYLDALKPRLETMGKVLRLEIYDASGGAVLSKAYAATRALAQAVDRVAEGDAFLARADIFFDDCRKRLALIGAPPVVLMGFLDARHARVYATPGLYDNVLSRIGVENAWKGQGNYWGFETIGIEDLARVTDPRARLIAFEPVPGDVLPKLAESPLWKALPISQPGRFSVIPGALMFGMVNDAMRFARLLTEHLENTA